MSDVCGQCGTPLLIDVTKVKTYSVFCPNESCAEFAHAFWIDKVPSRDRDQVPAPAEASELALSSAARGAAGDANKPANNRGVDDWRSRSQTKETWLGAKIPKTSALALGALNNLRRQVEEAICEEVAIARANGAPWSSIGTLLGTSGEAARQRYGGK